MSGPFAAPAERASLAWAARVLLLAVAALSAAGLAWTGGAYERVRPALRFARSPAARALPLLGALVKATPFVFALGWAAWLVTVLPILRGYDGAGGAGVVLATRVFPVLLFLLPGALWAAAAGTVGRAGPLARALPLVVLASVPILTNAFRGFDDLMRMNVYDVDGAMLSSGERRVDAVSPSGASARTHPVLRVEGPRRAPV